LATVDDVKGAKALKSEADSLKQQQYEATVKKLDRRFDKLVNQAIKRQGMELNQLQEKLATMLEKLSGVVEISKLEYQKKAAVYIRWALHKAITEARVIKREARLFISSELTKFVNQLLRDSKKEFLLEYGE
jgi:hypothetical protein